MGLNNSRLRWFTTASFACFLMLVFSLCSASATLGVSLRPPPGTSLLSPLGISLRSPRRVLQHVSDVSEDEIEGHDDHEEEEHHVDEEEEHDEHGEEGHDDGHEDDDHEDEDGHDDHKDEDDHTADDLVEDKLAYVIPGMRYARTSTTWCLILSSS